MRNIWHHTLRQLGTVVRWLTLELAHPKYTDSLAFVSIALLLQWLPFANEEILSTRYLFNTMLAHVVPGIGIVEHTVGLLTPIIWATDIWWPASAKYFKVVFLFSTVVSAPLFFWYYLEKNNLPLISHVLLQIETTVGDCLMLEDFFLFFLYTFGVLIC